MVKNEDEELFRENFNETITMQCHTAMAFRVLYGKKTKDLEIFTTLHFTNFNTLERGEANSRVALKNFYTAMLEIHAFILTKISSLASEYYLYNKYWLLGGEWFKAVEAKKIAINNKDLNKACKEYIQWAMRIAVLICIAKEYNIKLQVPFEHLNDWECYSAMNCSKADKKKFDESVEHYEERKYYLTKNAMKSLWKTFDDFLKKRDKKKQEIRQLLKAL